MRGICKHFEGEDGLTNGSNKDGNRIGPKHGKHLSSLHLIIVLCCHYGSSNDFPSVSLYTC